MAMRITRRQNRNQPKHGDGFDQTGSQPADCTRRNKQVLRSRQHPVYRAMDATAATVNRRAMRDVIDVRDPLHQLPS